MDVATLSDKTLYELHAGIRNAIKNDTDLRSVGWSDEAQSFVASYDAEKSNPLEYFGVKEYNDWQTSANSFEHEMSKRSLAFNAIDWSKV